MTICVRPRSMKKVAVYVRVSTQDQNHDMQLNELLKAVESSNFILFKIYSDTGSGTKSNRIALQELLTDARSKKFDIVMTWKLDRLFRSLRHLVTTLNELQELGVEFISLRDSGIDSTTPSGRLLTHLLASFAEFEAAIIRERVLAGLNAAKHRGVKLGTPRKINHCEVERLIIQGLSQKQIASNLNISEPSVSRIKKLSKGVLCK